MRISPSVKDETSLLKTVIVGTATSSGPVPLPEECYDPKSREHVLAGTYPAEPVLIAQMEQLVHTLTDCGVNVLRPRNLPGTNQIFTRDIGFVIDSKYIVPNIIRERVNELDGVQHIVDCIDTENMVHAPANVRVEGGDVMPWNDMLFVGYSEEEDFQTYRTSRTNTKALQFLQETFPDRTVRGFQLRKSDTDARQNALHLDCCFQPIGTNSAILFPGGFKNDSDVTYLREYFGADNIIEITREEMYLMYSNVFSVSPTTIISCTTFTRLNTELRSLGFTVLEVQYDEVAKMEGLFRCSTLPLERV